MDYQRFKFLPLRAIGYRGRVWRQINSRQDRWEKQYLVLEEGALSYYADEQCSLRYDSLFISNTCRIEARSDEYLGERFILKLSINNNEGNIQWSVSSQEEQSAWVEALSSEISGSFPIIKQAEIWPNFTSSCLVLPAFNAVDSELKVLDGNYIPASKMLAPPSISLKFANMEKISSKNYYTFIMIDMDFTNSSECSPRQYLLWAKANITNEDGADGEEWISYQPPTSSDKSMDAHRIFFLVLLQESRLNVGSSIIRDHFQLTQFAKLYSLLLPVGINGCYASNQQTSDVRSPQRTNSNMSNNSSLNLNEVDNSVMNRNNFHFENFQNWSKLSPSYVSHSENSYLYHVEECHEEEFRKIPQKKLISVLKSPGSKTSNKKSVSFKLDDVAQPIKAPFNVSIELMLDVYAEEDDDNQPDYEIRKFSSSSESIDDIEASSISNSNDEALNGSGSNIDGELLPLKIPDMMDADNLRLNAGYTPRVQKNSNKVQSPRNNTFISMSNGKTSTYNSWIETSTVFNNLSFSEKLKRLQKPQDMCAFFQIESTSIFIGEIVQKKYSADFLFKESFVWVNLSSQTLHWAKSSIHKSDPKKQKYIQLRKQVTNDDNYKDIGNYKGCMINVTQHQDKLILDLEGKRTLKIKGLGKSKLSQWIFVLKCLLHQSLSVE